MTVKIAFLPLLVLLILLTGCAASIDRHGRTITPGQPLTRETSPDPGRKPTSEEARKLIQNDLTERQQDVTILSIRDHAYQYGYGNVKSGWMVCFNSKGVNVFGGNFNFIHARMIHTDKDGELKIGIAIAGRACL